MKRAKPVHTASVVARVFPEEHNIPRSNVGIQGMNMSDYIHRTYLSIRLRRTSKERRRLRELARVGANINQLTR